MDYRRLLMSRVVPGQFDDADSSDSENVLKIIKAEDGILFEDFQNNVIKKSESEIKVEEEEEEDYDDDSDWDWDDGVGKLTKGYVWNGGSNPQVFK
uniref:Uncharacterized protein n=1 Tax=Spermophilus dauricus TaxID=99837 RepID=A0A8C9PKB1_SPEDA